MNCKRIRGAEVVRWATRPRTILLAAALALSMVLRPHWPKDRTIHYVLGDAAPRVEEVDARWIHGDSVDSNTTSDEEWMRTVSFRYDEGQAPRIVTHEPRLPDGNYSVEIEVVASSPEHEEHVTVVHRQVALGAGTTSIDLADSLVDRLVPR